MLHGSKNDLLSDHQRWEHIVIMLHWRFSQTFIIILLTKQKKFQWDRIGNKKFHKLIPQKHNKRYFWVNKKFQQLNET